MKVKKIPGRLQSIYTAKLLAKKNAFIFIHDCNRDLEKAACDTFFNEDQLLFELCNGGDRGDSTLRCYLNS